MQRIYKTDCISMVGTELASGVILETILNNNLQNELDVYFVNIDTIIRNALDCVPGKKNEKAIKFKNLAFLKKVFKEVRLTLDVFINTFADSKTNLIFYDVNYREISKKISNFKSLDEFSGVDYIRALGILEIKDMLYREGEINVQKTSFKFPIIPDNEKWAITTHSTVELLNYSYKKNIILLESFTGEIKDYKKWYTKYHPIGKRDMSVFPFNDILYFLLGDKYYIRPLDLKTRNKLYKIAEKNKWNFNTSRVKVKEDIKREAKDIYENYVKLLPRWFFT